MGYHVIIRNKLLVGGFNPSECISQLGFLFQIYGTTIKNVPNHQPD